MSQIFSSIEVNSRSIRRNLRGKLAGQPRQNIALSADQLILGQPPRRLYENRLGSCGYDLLAGLPPASFFRRIEQLFTSIDEKI